MRISDWISDVCSSDLDSPFDPRRSNRGEETVIDGHETHWYRGEIASAPDAQVRETLIELDDGRVAHISLRAASEAELADALQQDQIDRKSTRLNSSH